MFGRIAFLFVVGAACRGPSDPPAGDQEPEPTTAPIAAWDLTDDGRMRFAIIGDYGTGSAEAIAVGERVASWDPEFIITLGDNNYPSGEAATLPMNVDAVYGDFLGSDTEANRFFACTGNHDWHPTEGLQPYEQHFDLPGNERYYALSQGPVDLFCLSSDPREPDGIDVASVQAAWLESALADSDADWRLVYNHHPPYSSGLHGDSSSLDWPFAAWGADAMWSGHDHDYERIERDGMLFGVQGTSGVYLRSMGSVATEGSDLAFDDDHGATLVRVDSNSMTFTSMTHDGVLVDEVRQIRGLPLSDRLPLVPAHAMWSYGTERPTADWLDVDYDASDWSTGRSSLGGSASAVTTIPWGVGPRGASPRWFRIVFEVADPNAVQSPVLQLGAMDGVLAWLNGTEVHRQGLPEGPVDARTEVTPLDAAEPRSVPIDPTLLVAGSNVLALQVHPAEGDAGRAYMDATLRARLAADLIPEGSKWTWHHGTLPGERWEETGFDDSNWSRGGTPAGWGDPDLVSLIETTLPQRTPATWLRRDFQVDDATAVRGLLLRTLRGDGVSVSINGVEVWRSGLSMGALSGESYAPAATPEPWRAVFAPVLIEPEVLVEGTNTIAVQVHISEPRRPMRFDLSLAAIREDPVTP